MPNATATPTTVQPALQAIAVRQALDIIAPNTASPIVNISCPAGYVVTSGGLLGGDGGKTVPVQDGPPNITTWSAVIFNGSNYSEKPTFGIECVKVTGVSLVSQILGHGMKLIAPHSSSGFIYTTCPAGYIASGGGFRSSSPNFTIANNAPISSNPAKWLSEVYNSGNDFVSIVTLVACLSAPNLHQKIVSQNIGPLAAHEYSAYATCPAGYVLGGGGIDSGYPDLYAPQDGPGYISEWIETVFSTGANGAEAQVDVTCLKIG